MSHDLPMRSVCAHVLLVQRVLIIGSSMASLMICLCARCAHKYFMYKSLYHDSYTARSYGHRLALGVRRMPPRHHQHKCESNDYRTALGVRSMPLQAKIADRLSRVKVVIMTTKAHSLDIALRWVCAVCIAGQVRREDSVEHRHPLMMEC